MLTRLALLALSNARKPFENCSDSLLSIQDEADRTFALRLAIEPADVSIGEIVDTAVSDNLAHR